MVVKPDQLIKRRGKLGLIAVNKNFAQVKEWVNERMGKDQTIGNAVGKLRTFIIEPFIPHKEVFIIFLHTLYCCSIANHILIIQFSM